MQLKGSFLIPRQRGYSKAAEFSSVGGGEHRCSSASHGIHIQDTMEEITEAEPSAEPNLIQKEQPGGKRQARDPV